MYPQRVTGGALGWPPTAISSRLHHMIGGTSQLPTNTSGLLKRQTPLEPILWQNVQVHIVTEWTWTWKFLTCDFWRDQGFCPGSHSKPRPPPPCNGTISPAVATAGSSLARLRTSTSGLSAPCWRASMPAIDSAGSSCSDAKKRPSLWEGINRAD